jgi:membrane-associated protein
MHHAVLQLMATYGYPGLLALMFVAALGIAAPIPVTLLLVTLGSLSSWPGGPSLPLLAVAAVAGATCGHSTDYWCGRLGTRLVSRWLARAQRAPAVGGLLDAAIRLRGGRALLVFLSRFLLSPIASPVSLFAGATRMRFALYLCLEALGSAVYVLSDLLLGRAFGSGLLAHGAALPAFWLAVAALTMLPLALLRLANRLLGQARPSAPTAPTAPTAPSALP